MPDQNGYTLIELLVVMVVILIIIALLVLGIFFGCGIHKSCQKAQNMADKVSYSECVEACAKLEGEEAEAACMKKCE